MWFYKAISAPNLDQLWADVTFPDALTNIPYEAINRAGVDNSVAYFADIINNVVQWWKSFLHTFNPYSMSRNGVIKNTIKAPINGVLHWIKSVKNAFVWMWSWARNWYRHALQSNIVNFSNAISSKIPVIRTQVAKTVGHILNFWSIVGWAPLAAVDWVGKKVDNILDYAIEKTLLEWQENIESRMRQGTISDDGLKMYGAKV